MARPYILVQRDVLEEIEELSFRGVPARRLCRDYNLTIAAPTLTRLITYLAMATRSIVDGEQSLESKDIILNSLFPQWLEEIDKDEVSQPPDWYYDGAMPLGKWIKREKKGK